MPHVFCNSMLDLQAAYSIHVHHLPTHQAMYLPNSSCAFCDRFCWPCITQWSERETRCPFCKQRFSQICRKALYLGDPHSEPPSKRHKPNSAAADAALAAAAALAGNAAADEAAGEQQNSGSSSPSSPRGKLDGVVLETKRVAARDQVYMPEGDVADFLQALHCMVCGGDENEEQLLICDGECTATESATAAAAAAIKKSARAAASVAGVLVLAQSLPAATCAVG